jgi:flagellar hook protein FlgE
MYQDRIGKGSTVLDAEKLYTQGGSKLTGVNYDMALSGDGFFTVMKSSTSGGSETFYTRAGNFRMGDNGTLQDSGGNEVQGWMMSPIDSQNDVTSTNPNASVFTSDYTNPLGSRIIRHSNYIETITAKATDYNTTAKSDSTTVFSGDGGKTKSSKVSDIELAIKDYTNWLQKLKEEPDALSSTSIAQTSQINFKSGNESIIGKDSDQIYVYINGSKVSQNFLVTNSTQSFKEDLYNSLTPAERTAGGFVDPVVVSPAKLTDSQIAVYDKAAGKIATYKALADQISNIPGLVATMAIDSGKADAFNTGETYTTSTKNVDMLKGIIQIKSLIPGNEFKISEVAESAGTNAVVQGNFQTTSTASKGSGIGALDTARDALSKLITGKQQDVYTPVDLGIGTSAGNYTYGITIYDKELKVNRPIPNDGGVPPQAVNISISNASSIDDIVSQINANSDLASQVMARNVNGNLVVETLDSNYDVEFTGSIKQLPSMKIDLNNLVDNATYTFNILGQNLTVNTLDTTDETTIRSSLLSQIAANPNLADKVSLSELSNGAFNVYSTDSSVSFATSSVSISGDVLPTAPTVTTAAGTPTTLEADTLTITPADSTTYTFSVLGETVTYTSGIGATSTDIYNGLSNAIATNSNLTGLISVGALSGNNFNITQTALQNTASPAGLAISGSANLSSSTATAYVNGVAQTHTFTPTLAATDSASVFTLSVEGVDLKVKTDSTPTVTELQAALNIELQKNPNLAAKITITDNGTDLVITENIDSKGYQGLASVPSFAVSSLTLDGDAFKTASTIINEAGPIDVNSNYSGRKGGGAEFIEIVNKVDQTSTKGSLQLRLDTLGISDSPFGEFSVDSTGLITMKQDGVEFAVGQVSVAVFNNNRGLNPVGNNLLAKTNESGDPVYNLNNAKTAEIESKTLELSTADLSESLVNLMVFQRAFEANAKSITTADELLTTLIGLKR